MGNWKSVFMEQRAKGTLEIWAEPLTVLRIPKFFNLRTDPFERADITSNTYWHWYLSKAYLVMASQAVVQPFLDSFKSFRHVRKQLPLASIRRWKKMAQSFNSGH